jgi:outer membrane protein
MKKIVLCLVAVSCFMSSFAQTDASTDFDRWKLRIKGAVIESDGVIDQDANINGENGQIRTDAGYFATLDLSYFFTKNIALEAMIANSKNEASAYASVLGGNEGITQLGDYSVLLPTLMLQYHFKGQKVTPYIGAGINYASFYDVNPSSEIVNVEYENTPGPAFQAGIDFDILNLKIFGKTTFLNLDAKLLVLNSEAIIDASNINTSYQNVPADMHINPFVFSFGFGINL